MRSARVQRRVVDDRKAIAACKSRLEESLATIRELEQRNQARRQKQQLRAAVGGPAAEAKIARVAEQIARDEATIAKLHADNARRAWSLFERGVTYKPSRGAK